MISLKRVDLNLRSLYRLRHRVRVCVQIPRHFREKLVILYVGIAT